jgi:hypothetical protein
VRRLITEAQIHDCLSIIEKRLTISNKIVMERFIKLKNRSDIGAGTRGSDLGIDAIEIAAINRNSDFSQFEFEDVKTHNESIYDKIEILLLKELNMFWSNVRESLML